MSNAKKQFMLGDQDLITGCNKNDNASQKALYERYCRKMAAICMRYAPSREEAEDILQEGFLRIFQRIGSFRGESKLDTWMTRIMINTALNYLRGKLYLMPLVDSNELEIAEDEKISLAGFHLSELIAVVQSLPQGCRVVFNLFAIEGYGHQEIAGLLGISEGTSKSQYSRARALLKSRLTQMAGEIKRYGE